VTSSDEGEVLRATAELVRRSWELLGEAEARPPLRSDQITRLLVRSNTRLCEYPFTSGATGMAIPWGADEHAILIDSAASRSDYQFTIRHELAHVLAGEVSTALFLTASDTMSFSERRADLFAVTDLVPGWLIRQLRGTRRPWSHVRLEVQQAFREHTVGWSEERIRDRAKLRVALYREREM
jgi:hypothetical protein